jgi:hypothetical protein
MTDDVEFVIARRDDLLTSAELRRRLEASPSWDPEIQIRIVKSAVDTRPIDPTYLAVVAAGSAAIGALFTALGGVAQSLGKQKIAVRWADGTTVEVEGRNAEETVRRIVALLESKPASRIVVSV